MSLGVRVAPDQLLGFRRLGDVRSGVAREDGGGGAFHKTVSGCLWFNWGTSKVRLSGPSWLMGKIHGSLWCSPNFGRCPCKFWFCLTSQVLPMLPHGLCNHLCSLNPLLGKSSSKPCQILRPNLRGYEMVVRGAGAPHSDSATDEMLKG